MKLFTYITQSPRATKPEIYPTSNRAIVHSFRLLTANNQVKFVGYAFFRSEKDAKNNQLGKDATLPLIEAGATAGCTQIQYWLDDAWQTLES